MSATKIRALAIRRLAAQSTVVGALLGAIDTLAPERRKDELAKCAGLASDIACQLVALVRSST